MSVEDITPGEDRELYRRGLGFLKRAHDLRGLSPTAFDRIEKCLQRPWPAPRRRPWLLAATVVSVVLLAGTIAVARVGLRQLPLVGALFEPKATEPVTTVTRRARRVVTKAVPASAVPEQPGATPALPQPVAAPTAAQPGIAPRESPAIAAPLTARAVIPEPVAAKPGPATPAPRRQLALASPVATPRTQAPAAAPSPEVSAPAREIPVPVENPVLAESRVFSAAIERWHRAHDPTAALAALDEHDRRFPTGHFQTESRLLRAEILLAQGREREGLALLDRLNLAGSPRARELFTVRGELRIKLGRCSEGRADLDQVVSRGVSDSFGKRAAEAMDHCQ